MNPSKFMSRIDWILDEIPHVIEGDGGNAIVHFVRQQETDLFVIWLHQRDLSVARLWSTGLRTRTGGALQHSGRSLALSHQEA